jgi:hypothetical protein
MAGEHRKNRRKTRIGVKMRMIGASQIGAARDVGLAFRIKRGRSAVSRRRHDRGDGKNCNGMSRKLLASTESFEKTGGAQSGAPRERAAAQLAYIIVMTDEIAFLYETAAELRAMAAAAPDIGEELRHMAEELEEEAGKLARNRRGRHGSGRAQPLW